jgi:hypothetical protein
MSFGLTISVPAKLEMNGMDLEELEEWCHQILLHLFNWKEKGIKYYM